MLDFTKERGDQSKPTLDVTPKCVCGSAPLVCVLMVVLAVYIICVNRNA